MSDEVQEAYEAYVNAWQAAEDAKKEWVACIQGQRSAMVELAAEDLNYWWELETAKKAAANIYRELKKSKEAGNE